MRSLLLPALVVGSAFAMGCGAAGSSDAANAAPATAVVIDTADAEQYMIPLPRSAAQPLRDAIAALENGDVAGMTANMADSIVMVMPNGNELRGKQVVAAYWEDRFKRVLKTLKYSKLAALSFNLYRSDAGATLGTYHMVWYTVDATYQTGKSVTFPAHLAVHVDSTGKFDRWLSYYDTQGIALATGN